MKDTDPLVESQTKPVEMPMQTAFCGDDKEPDALPVDMALGRILQTVVPLGPEDGEIVDLRESLDRVLADDLIATVNVPAHDNSAMDGYALNSRDLPVEGTGELRVVGSSFAGHPFTGHFAAGECIRIMTGAIMPVGADTVIPQERVETIDGAKLRIDARTRAGDNVRYAGEDIRLGQLVLCRGRRIAAADLGLMASVGLAEVSVVRRVTVGYFSTGDELRSVGEPLRPGEIYDSNRYTLFGMLSHQHCEIADLGVVRDDPKCLRQALQAAAEEYDVVISSGGVSVGEADHVRPILEELGEMAFWKVAMRPGRPLSFGRLGNALFFGLPGNPVAVMVSFSQFVQPALRRLSGEVSDPPLILRAVSTSSLRKRPGRTEYQRGILSQNQDGSLAVCKTGQQGSGILTSMSRANCFIILPPEQTRVEPGTLVMVQPFASEL